MVMLAVMVMVVVIKKSDGVGDGVSVGVGDSHIGVGVCGNLSIQWVDAVHPAGVTRCGGGQVRVMVILGSW